MKITKKYFPAVVVLFVILLCASCSDYQLEIVAELSQAPGNIAVTPDGRLIVSQHSLYDPLYRVIEVLPDGTVKPFPNEQWATEPGEDDVGLSSVLGIRSDLNGIIWMLDNGSGFSRLVAWDSRKDVLHDIIDIPEPVRKSNSFFNDLAIDPVHNKIYISDPAGPESPAIVIVDIESGSSRRVLEGHESVVPEPLPIVIGDKTMGVDRDGNGVPMLGIDPITIDPESEWLYYGPSQGSSLWRIRTEDLVDESLSENDLSSRIERYGDRPVCDGITVDGAGNIYITDVTSYAVGVIEPSGEYRILYRDESLLVWPDGMSFGPDGYIYVASSQLHLAAALNNGEDLSKKPYYIVRFKALAKGSAGR